MTTANTIIGDLKACRGSKKRRLEEFIQTEDLDDIGRELKGPKEWTLVGDPYTELRELAKSWTRVVRICDRSKRWWKREWKPLRKKARKCKKARKKFHEEIRKAKREMWVQYVEEGKSIWDIARTARNPFNLKTRADKVEDEDG